MPGFRNSAYLTANLSEQSVSAVALAPDGQTLAIGSGERLESSKGRVELWDAASGERTRILSATVAR